MTLLPAPAPLYFPAGSMLGVIRAAHFDPHGDGDYQIDHEIGPCDIPMSALRSEMRGTTHEARSRSFVDVRAPSGSDIRRTDRIRLPSGIVCHLIGEPEYPRNPFTNWAPFVHFQLEVVS